MPDLLVRKSPNERAAVIQRIWEGETVAVIATGPSLTKSDLDLVSGLKCIAVNDAYLVAPWAKVLYAADERWWKWQADGRNKSWSWGQKFNQDGVRKAYREFQGQKVTIQHTQVFNDPDVLVLENDGQDGLSERPDAVRTGQHSCYQAINIATLSGAKKILVLACDLRYVNNRSHAHNGHHPTVTDESAYRRYAKNFRTIENPLKKMGVEVVNCAPGSEVKSFRFSTVEKELCLAPS